MHTQACTLTHIRMHAHTHVPVHTCMINIYKLDVPQNATFCILHTPHGLWEKALGTKGNNLDRQAVQYSQVLLHLGLLKMHRPTEDTAPCWCNGHLPRWRSQQVQHQKTQAWQTEAADLCYLLEFYFMLLRDVLSELASKPCLLCINLTNARIISMYDYTQLQQMFFKEVRCGVYTFPALGRSGWISMNMEVSLVY